MSTRRHFLLIFMSIAILTATSLAVATPSRFTTIDYPGATQTFIWGINAPGDVTGSYVDSAGNEHGFLLHDGAFTTIDYPGADWTEAFGITAAGEIVGQYGLASEQDTITHGFRLHSGTFSSIEIAGATDKGSANSMPFGIMPDGTVVGCYHESSPTGAQVAGTMMGFVLKGTSVIFSGVAGTMHTAVNANGDLVGYGAGYATGATAAHGYIVKDGTTSWFSVPGSASTQARGIAANGDVTGVYTDATTKKVRGYLYRQGTFASFDVPGATATRPMAMNAIGDIAGYYNDTTGGIHGFVFAKTGWWFNPDKPGTGFMMERQAEKMQVTAFVYDYDGTPTWLTASGSIVNGNFSAAAHTFAKGQTLTGAYQPALDAGAQGILGIQFTDAGTAQLSWTPNPFMWVNMTLQRFGFTGGPGTWGTVENGWWSNPAEPGRTFALEVQDNNIFIIGSMFDDAGRPTWYLSYGAMTDPMQFSGTWTQYGMGANMLGMGGSPMVMNKNVGSLQVKFTDARNGTVTLPDGRQAAITRVSF